MMKSVTTSALSLSAFAAALVMLHGAPASAQAAKTWVSHFGNDSLSCTSPASPCLTFFGALTKTAPGGEIGVVDAGDYGPVAISQPINITNDGAGEASVVNRSTVAITILAGVGDIVSLRGLVIDGQSGGTAGIFIGQASAVHIQSCVIRNFEGSGAGAGILLRSGGQLFVSETIIFNNGSTAGTGGVLIQPQGTASINVVLDRVHLENNVVGLQVSSTGGTASGAHVVIRDSVVSGNAGDGIQAVSAPGQAPAFIVVERTSVVNNAGTGIVAAGPHATMLLNDNTVARNAVGIAAGFGGQLISYGNNKVNNNLGPDGVPTGSYSPI